MPEMWLVLSSFHVALVESDARHLSRQIIPFAFASACLSSEPVKNLSPFPCR
jgi:hypothetical protein